MLLSEVVDWCHALEILAAVKTQNLGKNLCLSLRNMLEEQL